MSTKATFQDVSNVVASLSEAAKEALDWFDLDEFDQVASDLDMLLSGDETPSSMLEDILEGNTAPDTEQGWREYVATLEAHVAREMKS